MTKTLEPLLSPFRSELMIVLEASESANSDRLDLSQQIADCNSGPYERVRWLDAIAKNLNSNNGVRLINPSNTENYLQIEIPGEPLNFALYFGVVDSEHRYKIHNKGPNTRRRSGVQFELPGFVTEVEEVPDEYFPYALRIRSGNEERSWFELHLVIGGRPCRASKEADAIRSYGRYIIRRDEDVVVPESYEVPFEPVGIV